MVQILKWVYRHGSDFFPNKYETGFKTLAVYEYWNKTSSLYST